MAGFGWHELLDVAETEAKVIAIARDYLASLEPREVGRMRYPSNVLGLLFHAAEHTQRHAGQMASVGKVLHGGGRGDVVAK